MKKAIVFLLTVIRIQARTVCTYNGKFTREGYFSYGEIEINAFFCFLFSDYFFKFYTKLIRQQNLLKRFKYFQLRLYIKLFLTIFKIIKLSLFIKFFLILISVLLFFLVYL